jgi:lysophospholipase L1-like esterase
MTILSPERACRRRGWRKHCYRALALLMAFGVAFAAAEVALRVGGYQLKFTGPFSSFHEVDNVLGWHGKPNFAAQLAWNDIHVMAVNNELGFRQVEHRQDLSTAQRNVFVLGDSFVWGWGVGQDHVVTDQLERLLPGCRVHNLGLVAAGTVHEYMIFKKHVLPQLQPKDAVVLAFYGNDFGDNIGYNHPGRLSAFLKDGKVCVAPPEGMACQGMIENKLKSNSYVINLMAFSIDSLRLMIGGWRNRSRQVQPAAGGSGPPPRDGATTPVDLADNSPEIQITKHYLRELKTACDQKHAQFLLVYVPWRAEFGEPDFATASLPARDWESPERRAFFHCAKALGIETVDLLAHFQRAKQADKQLQLTYRQDFHWNDNGHLLAAEAVSAHLLDRDRGESPQTASRISPTHSTK